MSQIILSSINEKFSEAILFIIKNTSSSDIGLKKLAKLLYFSDFNQYKKNYESITNEEYSRLEHGPFPKKLYITLQYLEEQGWINITEIKYTDKIVGKNIKILKQFEPKYISTEEQSEILNVIKKIGTLSAKQLEDLSHKDTPWQVTDECDLINYDLVFYRDGDLIKQVE